jgi:hypothetical protein
MTVIEPLAETEAAACRATYEVTAARVPKRRGSSTAEGEKMAMVIEPLAET